MHEPQTRPLTVPSQGCSAGSSSPKTSSMLSLVNNNGKEAEKRRKEQQLKRQIGSFREEQLWQLLQEVKGEAGGLANQKTLVEQIAGHPRASPRIWKELLKNGSAYSEFAVSQVREARQIPEIRQRLQESDVPQVWVHLCRDAEADELTRLFKRLVYQNADTALTFLENYPAKVDEIDEEVLTELLKADNELDRARVFRVLGRRYTEDSVKETS